MSHFSVGVILPRYPQTQMQTEIERLLAPYDEKLKVPEYDQICYCVNREAHTYGRSMADKLIGTWEERRILFHQLPEYQPLVAQRDSTFQAKNWDAFDEIDDQITALWQTCIPDFKQEWEATADDYAAYHPRFNQPCANCSGCDGSGTYRSTYNPASKWDWYRIGGRFDGLIIENPQSSEGGFNFAAKHETLANNSVPVQELLDRHAATGDVFTAYALVTPEGEWIGQGEMGWWGMSSGDKPQNVWNEQTLTIYRKYAALDMVLLDCHI